MGILDGKVAIVTGASRGIGAEIARRFGAAGAAVAVSARTTEAGTSPFAGTIGDTVQDIRAGGGTAVAIRADLARPEDRESLVSQTIEQLGAPAPGRAAPGCLTASARRGQIILEFTSNI